jgi:hypothetical protein
MQGRTFSGSSFQKIFNQRTREPGLMRRIRKLEETKLIVVTQKKDKPNIRRVVYEKRRSHDGSGS